MGKSITEGKKLNQALPGITDFYPKIFDILPILRGSIQSVASAFIADGVTEFVPLPTAGRQ